MSKGVRSGELHELGEIMKRPAAVYTQTYGNDTKTRKRTPVSSDVHHTRLERYDTVRVQPLQMNCSISNISIGYLQTARRFLQHLSAIRCAREINLYNNYISVRRYFHLPQTHRVTILVLVRVAPKFFHLDRSGSLARVRRPLRLRKADGNY